MYKIYLKLENIPQKKEEFLSYLRNEPDIYWIGECDGQWDLIFAFYAGSDVEF
ncbi:MAG: hypothetical protein GXO64_03055, partial [Candidatus Micrarchaeota archaeon]|nr:hypothetical protein [Candidatus Micrarchaeota archaeon]